MADAPRPDPLPLYEVPYTRLFPWLRLFHAPVSATDPKRLVLAALGLLLTRAGWAALDRLFPHSSWSEAGLLARLGPSQAWIPWPSDFRQLGEPVTAVVAPFLPLFSARSSPPVFTHAALAAAWVLIVWGLVGGAIARVAAVSLARQERVGLRAALRFSARKALPLVGTPTIALLGVVVITTLMAGFGLLYRLGPAGATVAGGLAFLPLLGGLVLALIVGGLALGWPLMAPAVAAEDEDGFDAMSRAYAYVHQRPWHYAAYALLAAALGAVGLVVVNAFAWLAVYLTAWALGFGGPSVQTLSYYGFGNTPEASAATTAHWAWLAAVDLAVRAWSYSYFWTVATAAYLLFRLDVDGTPWSKVAYTPAPNPLLTGAPPAEGAAPEKAPGVDPGDAV